MLPTLEMTKEGGAERQNERGQRGRESPFLAQNTVMNISPARYDTINIEPQVDGQRWYDAYNGPESATGHPTGHPTS